MRLGQLARKLAITRSEIIEFLIAHNIQLEDGSNTKVEDNHVALIMQHFSPAEQISISEFNKKESNNGVDNFVSEPLIKGEHVQEVSFDNIGFSSVTHQIEETKPIEEREAEMQTSQSLYREEDSEEVIRAPKVELPGLKVIGKIEILEPKKKDITPEENSLVLNNPSSDVERKRQPKTENLVNRQYENNNRPRKNPIAAQREQESFKMLEKKSAEAERQKELRTQRYQKKVKVSSSIKSLKRKDELFEEITSIPEDNPKTLWAKFVKWLKT